MTRKDVRAGQLREEVGPRKKGRARIKSLTAPLPQITLFPLSTCSLSILCGFTTFANNTTLPKLVLFVDYAKFLPQHHLLNADTTAAPTASFIVCLSAPEEDRTCLSYLYSACPQTGLSPNLQLVLACLSVLHIVLTVPTSLTILHTSHQVLSLSLPIHHI